MGQMSPHFLNLGRTLPQYIHPSVIISGKHNSSTDAVYDLRMSWKEDNLGSKNISR